jgi:hypothetical protein
MHTSTAIASPDISVIMSGHLDEAKKFMASSSLSRCMEALGQNTEAPEKETKAPNGSATAKDILKQLKEKAEAVERRLELVIPTSLENFKANLWWIIEQGVEEDLDLLRRIKKNLPYDSEDVQQLVEMAEHRIRERVNAPDRVIEKGEEAYQLHKAEWEAEFSGHYIAIYRGELIGNATTKSELFRQINEAQKQSGPLRAYIIKLGAPQLIARGPRFRLGGQKYPTKSGE